MSAQGVWINEYGSKMALAVEADGAIAGLYESTTGATGKYRVVGHQGAGDPTPDAGQPVALAIEWHSIAAGPADPGGHWSSGLSGQISVQNGMETMVLIHSLVVSTPYPGLAPVGRYIDKLTYKRLPEQELPIETAKAVQSAVDPLVGRWCSVDDTTLDIAVTPYASGEFGWVFGKITTGLVAADVTGVTDINATSDGLTLQSAAVTARLSPKGPLLSLSGSLDLKTGVLTLLELSSQPTAPDATYLQTAISTRTYRKVDREE